MANQIEDLERQLFDERAKNEELQAEVDSNRQVKRRAPVASLSPNAPQNGYSRLTQELASLRSEINLIKSPSQNVLSP